ncbi:MAG: DNA gyrase subunit A [Gemmatimonadetes bacterium]|nr:DNA gyrase subunit A [Gemmatimonadota bacterium]MYG86656.1 DNA gyrase subunit A [Gemmatimonadota bacterium]MYJ89223.1 DNA gyrase subunit A [Gemmatimonadota bacterium]
MAVEQHDNIQPIFIEDEMKSSYLDFSMSVNLSRAIPDVRDGFKPSQRRILVAMRDLNLTPGRPTRKCAKIVGQTIGDYHPHGDLAVYDTLARMAQPFSMRYPMVFGQGNFGSVDGDPPGAMRYTESRMSRLAIEMMEDIDKNTVDFMPNYDESKDEPTVLPGKFPNLLCNGSLGIGVGMASNLPSHNLGEVVDGIVAVIDHPEITIGELAAHIQGPDFATGAIIYGRNAINEYFHTGRGKIKVRARTTIEVHEQSEKETIVVTEIPYKVNKSSLIEKIADLVREKQILGITDIRDESDRSGMRIAIDVRRDIPGNIVLNHLFKMTPLETTIGVTMLALVDGRPRVLNIKECIQHFIDHRHEVLVRRTTFDLEKAEQRAHIVEGLRVALDNVDRVIEVIRGSHTGEEAMEVLGDEFALSRAQVEAILDMRLQRLTGLERDKLEEEYEELVARIADYRDILSRLERRMQIIKDEMIDLKERYGDERRTELIDIEGDLSIEDLIADEEMVITISHAGYVKRLPMDTYRSQNRGGKGITGMKTREEDFVEHLFSASTHSYILFFTNRGKCYWLKVWEIPEAGRTARGKAVVNLLQLDQGESIAAFLPIRNFDDEHYILMVTRGGLVKKTVLSAYGNPRRNGIVALNILEGDALIEALLTDGDNDIVIASQNGQAVRFHESDVRTMGRGAQGVRGIRLGEGDRVVGMLASDRDTTLLSVTENGYGKRTDIENYRLTRRHSKGVSNIRTSERNGPVVSIHAVSDEDELMIITTNGLIIRLPVRDLRPIGRNTQGVRLINLGEGDRVIDVSRITPGDEEDDPATSETDESPGSDGDEEG